MDYKRLKRGLKKTKKALNNDRKNRLKRLFSLNGAGARNRTETGSPPRDFESRASTNFTTPALISYKCF